MSWQVVLEQMGTECPFWREAGKMHRAAKKYPVRRNVCESDERYGFEAEISSH